MRLTRFERDAQGLARTKQVLLADHLVKRLGPEAFGQGDRCHWCTAIKSGKGIVVQEPVRLTENRLQNTLNGRYSTGILVNRTLLALQILRNSSALHIFLA